MKKLLFVMLLVMIPLVNGIEDCVTLSPLTEKDLPCMIITPYPYTEDCSSYQVKIYNSTPTLVGQTTLTTYTGTDLCNTTFNLSFNKTGDYIINISAGDSLRISVEVDNTMMIAIAIMLSVFFIVFVGVGLFLFFKRSQNAD